MTMRPCLDCGTPADGSRCQPCEAGRLAEVDQRRGTPTARGYNAAWARLSARARKLQPFCQDCGTTTNLTADHLQWPARTLADVAVVCGGCNNRRGPARGPNSTRGVTPRRGPSAPSPQASTQLHSVTRDGGE